MNLDSKCFYVVGTVSSSCEIRQVELDLIPTFVQSHGHGADEWLYSGGRLIVGGSESSSHALVIKYLHFEGEVLFEVLNDHDEEGQLNAERLVGVGGAGDVVGRDVSAHDLEDGGLDIGVGDTFDVPVAHTLVPDLQRLRSTRSLTQELTRWSTESKGTRTGRCS